MSVLDIPVQLTTSAYTCINLCTANRVSTCIQSVHMHCVLLYGILYVCILDSVEDGYVSHILCKHVLSICMCEHAYLYVSVSMHVHM